ncbi:tryptophan--tRNA ligase [Candidatus Jorgensenbacteria bacterium GWA1_54_12]|uniref:Tryptophan--tRNA ligase n=1 Tax=Candidatus Jorgensenbacteria bacterium GWA1_54_12 TaxID=1798468 RepID=A0A1F6BKM6_9BACT|nr:MAG: tryptophan--tRNA ligase [Candidatus Jorgensenbacteria bacterium GWA1_54_12]
MTKPVLVSGIQPSGRLHIGNFVGALRHFKELQDSGDYECLFFVADYHSITEPFRPDMKGKEVKDVVRMFLAAGLSPQKSTIFVQSHISAHTELAWIFSTLTPFGELSRMTQFKEKSVRQPSANIGLFTYPVLMAADILLYDTAVVPVGDDQLQHLEFTRTIARKFNAKFGKVFTEPKPLMTDIPRLMSLHDSEKKMSKSVPAGCLYLDDAPDDIRKKIASAVTDSGGKVRYSIKKGGGISNLMRIYGAFADLPMKDVEKVFEGKGYKEFKSALAELLIKKLSPFREARYSDKELEKVIAQGDKKARALADVKLTEVKKKIGLTR